MRWRGHSKPVVAGAHNVAVEGGFYETVDTRGCASHRRRSRPDPAHAMDRRGAGEGTARPLDEGQHRALRSVERLLSRTVSGVARRIGLSLVIGFCVVLAGCGGTSSVSGSANASEPPITSSSPFTTTSPRNRPPNRAARVRHGVLPERSSSLASNGLQPRPGSSRSSRSSSIIRPLPAASKACRAWC